jgi:hypothetical protein
MTGIEKTGFGQSRVRSMKLLQLCKCLDNGQGVLLMAAS